MERSNSRKIYRGIPIVMLVGNLRKNANYSDAEMRHAEGIDGYYSTDAKFVIEHPSIQSKPISPEYEDVYVCYIIELRRVQLWARRDWFVHATPNVLRGS